MDRNQIEAESALHYKAPRVTLDDIEKTIAAVHYGTGQSLMHIGGNDYRPGYDFKMLEENLGVLTLCLITTRSGFTVVGKSAPASLENYDPEYGKKLAYDDAFKQLWPLMGFALKQKLADQ